MMASLVDAIVADHPALARGAELTTVRDNLRHA
jgi:hypothetical protein